MNSNVLSSKGNPFTPKKKMNRANETKKLISDMLIRWFWEIDHKISKFDWSMYRHLCCGGLQYLGNFPLNNSSNQHLNVPFHHFDFFIFIFKPSKNLEVKFPIFFRRVFVSIRSRMSWSLKNKKVHWSSNLPNSPDW